jgi:hypothetical protein
MVLMVCGEEGGEELGVEVGECEKVGSGGGVGKEGFLGWVVVSGDRGEAVLVGVLLLLLLILLLLLLHKLLILLPHPIHAIIFLNHISILNLQLGHYHFSLITLLFRIPIHPPLIFTLQLIFHFPTRPIFPYVVVDNRL